MSFYTFNNTIVECLANGSLHFGFVFRSLSQTKQKRKKKEKEKGIYIITKVPSNHTLGGYGILSNKYGINFCTNLITDYFYNMTNYNLYFQCMIRYIHRLALLFISMYMCKHMILHTFDKSYGYKYGKRKEKKNISIQ